MNAAILVGAALLLVGGCWGAWWFRRSRNRSASAVPTAATQPSQALLSRSGQFKAVVQSCSPQVMRVEFFRRREDEPTYEYWVRVGGPSLVDQASLADVVEQGFLAEHEELCR